MKLLARNKVQAQQFHVGTALHLGVAGCLILGFKLPKGIGTWENGSKISVGLFARERVAAVVGQKFQNPVRSMD